VLSPFFLGGKAVECFPPMLSLLRVTRIPLSVLKFYWLKEERFCSQLRVQELNCLSGATTLAIV